MRISDLVRPSDDGRIADDLLRTIMPSLQSAENPHVLLNALAVAVAYVCIAAGDPYQRRAARAFFLRALLRNTAALLNALQVPRSRRYVGELLPAEGIGLWIGVAYDTAVALRGGPPSESLRERFPVAGFTMGGRSRRREERRLAALLARLSEASREARHISPPRTWQETG